MKTKYFNWIYKQLVSPKGRSYKKLFKHLHSIEFKYIIEMDENRAADGVNLRYRFLYAKGLDSNLMDYTEPCTVLEMLTALAIRCDETMGNWGANDGAKQWFWEMLNNLNLGLMTDDVYDEQYIDEVIFAFMNRQYQPDGVGNIFIVPYCEQDLRTVEIWYQMCWYLNTLLGLQRR